MEIEEIDTLEKLIEIVGKRMHHYHDFRRELAALRKAAQHHMHADGACVCGSTAFYDDKILGRSCCSCQAPAPQVM